MKFFSIAGPVNPNEHYCLPLSTRLNQKELRLLIEQKKYFILHAPRQTGKTSTILNWAQQLNEEGTYIALYINIEGGQAARAHYKDALPIILQEFATRVKEQLPQQTGFFEIFEDLKREAVPAGSLLTTLLSRWCAQLEKPLIIFIDEIDCLVGDTLISVLRQLRSGYDKRSKNFPQSVCLIGVRDVRDYRIWSEVEQKTILGGSAFNIKSESIRMADFTFEQVKQLYLQHTQATGQKFDNDAIDYAFEITQGQPWLTNALAYEACFRDVTDYTRPITKEVLERAKEKLIKRRDTHLDVLIDRLQEPRVYNIIDAILTGNIKTSAELKQDDILYARDLGLIKMKGLEIANPIYQEVIPRELTYAKQEEMIQDVRWYQNDDGTLSMTKLLEAFVEFYRENSADWLADCKYKESGPHLLMMAFLQRIINGGGKIHREYALGRKRLDLLLVWKNQKIVIELKVYKDAKTLPDGLMQTAEYMDMGGASEGHLIIFDKRDKSWEEKIYIKQEPVGNKIITVWGL
ncbi:MAG: AAA-like domain-containing protein [Oligoflexia bacterium]|nr:AAA-like domain-containing protein [Oligoflexia bacterium]